MSSFAFHLPTSSLVRRRTHTGGDGCIELLVVAGVVIYDKLVCAPAWRLEAASLTQVCGGIEPQQLQAAAHQVHKPPRPPT
eukprot:1097273-Rhodomonas_salina.1